MPSFLVNYGGPAPQLSSIQSSFAKTLANCEEFYKSKAQSVSFSRKGLNLTYYQVGIHRMIKVELPEQVNQDLKSGDSSVRGKAQQTAKRYRDARIAAGNFNTGKYKLLANNCVTAVAHVLNKIDPSILGGKKKVIPPALDHEVKKEVSFESMVDECLRGKAIDMDAEHKDYIQFDALAHQVWNEVMTNVGASQQSNLKAKMQSLQSADAPKSDALPKPDL